MIYANLNFFVFSLVADQNDPRHLKLIPNYILEMLKVVVKFSTEKKNFDLRKIKSAAALAKVQFGTLEKIAIIVEQWAEEMMKLQEKMKKDDETLMT